MDIGLQPQEVLAERLQPEVEGRMLVSVRGAGSASSSLCLAGTCREKAMTKRLSSAGSSSESR